MSKAVPLVYPQDLQTTQLQTNILNAIKPLLKNAVLSGNLVTSQALAVGKTSVQHGLNRSPLGWMIVRQRSAANVYDVQDANSAPSQTLDLFSDAAVTVDVYVF